MHKSSGFTLIEILIALFIFSIMSLLVTLGLTSVFKSKEILEQKLQATSELQIAVALLNQDLQQIIPRQISLANDYIEPPLYGNKYAINFTRAGIINPDAQAKHSGLERVEYTLQNHNLIRNSWGSLDRLSDQPDNSKSLLTEITKFSIVYTDANQRQYSYWPPQGKRSGNQLPMGIQVSIHSQQWGKINLAVKLTGESNYAIKQ